MTKTKTVLQHDASEQCKCVTDVTTTNKNQQIHCNILMLNVENTLNSEHLNSFPNTLFITQ